MESSLRHKDKAFRNVFKGTLLVNSLMDNEQHRFENRACAVAFAQKLLDARHIVSVVGDATFDDGMHMYRWADDTVVRDAKRLVTTTSSHIPRRRLIEMLDLQQMADDPHFTDSVKERLRSRMEVPADNTVTLFFKKGEYDSSHHHRLSGGGSQQQPELTGSLNAVNGRQLTKNVSLSTDEITLTGLSSLEGERQNVDLSTSQTDVCQLHCEDTELHIDTCADPCSAASEVRPTVDDLAMTTCRYDGVDMPALDLDNIYFDVARRQPAGSESVAAMARSVENLAEQSNSFSDNEKQLLEEMRRMQEKHRSMVNSYEDRIMELMQRIDSLRHITEVLDEAARAKTEVKETEVKEATEVKQAPVKEAATSTSAEVSTQTDIDTTVADVAVNSPTVNEMASTPEPPASVVSPPPPAPPPPPSASGVPAPPPPPSSLHSTQPRAVQPSKPAVQPRVKMRPLFWTRIVVENSKGRRSHKTFWHEAVEPNFDVDEFERLFGRTNEKLNAKAQSLHDSITAQKKTAKMKTVKLLDDNRSRAVAIKLRSMHCEMEDIRHAIYKMDFRKLDIDSLYGLYEIRATKKELDKIAAHIEFNESGALDHPEQFLYELSQMSHFAERMECLTLRKRFNETLFNINQQLDALGMTCAEIRNNESIRNILELVLAFGNYMNGGTQRGQADGFDLRILARLKDVKSMDNSTNLLQYIVRVYCREHDQNAGKNEAQLRLPLPASMQQASQISLTELDGQLSQLKQQVQTHRKKAKLVCRNSGRGLLQPFKDQMDDFFESADDMLKRQKTTFAETKTQFKELLTYFAFKDAAEKITPETFFSNWGAFLDDYKLEWEREQKRIAKEMFETVEEKRKERLNAAKRRRSIADDDKSNLKNKFSQLRRRSEQVSPQTFRRILRSQSIGGLEVVGITADGGPPPSPTTPTVPDQSLLRKRRPLSASYPAEQQADNDVFDSADSALTRSTGGESLAERIERRRQARISIINDSNEALGRGETNPIHEHIQRRRRSRLKVDDHERQEPKADASADKTPGRPQFMLRGRRNMSSDNLYASHDSLQTRGDANQLSPGEQYTSKKKQTTPLAALRGRWERQATAPSFSSIDGSTKLACIGIDGRRFSRYSSGGYSRKDDALSTDQAALAGRDYRETLRKLRGGNIVTQKRT